jgi:hypothetical protein
MTPASGRQAFYYFFPDPSAAAEALAGLRSVSAFL